MKTTTDYAGTIPI